MFHATKTLFMKNKLICIGATTFGAAAYFNDPIKSTMSYTNNRISYAAWSVAEKVAKTTASYSFGNNLFGQLLNVFFINSPLIVSGFSFFTVSIK